MTPTVRGWVASREPAPPAALAVRLTDALTTLDRTPVAGAFVSDAVATDARVDAAPAVEATLACLHAAEHTLTRVLRDGASDRALALDLLTADALVTYAFEAAGDDPAALPVLARDAMRRLSRLAVRDAT